MKIVLRIMNIKVIQETRENSWFFFYWQDRENLNVLADFGFKKSYGLSRINYNSSNGGVKRN